MPSGYIMKCYLRMNGKQTFKIITYSSLQLMRKDVFTFQACSNMT